MGEWYDATMKKGAVRAAFWRHFPEFDTDPKRLADATVEFAKSSGSCFVKLTPAAGYSAEIWGAKLTPAGNLEGTRNYISRPINSHSDWKNIGAQKLTNEVIARELAALKHARRAAKKEKLFQTVFSPMAVSKNLSDDLWKEAAASSLPEYVSALDAICETVISFGRACIKNGADGIFLATPMSNSNVISPIQYEQMEQPYLARMIQEFKKAGAEIILHMHGDELYFNDLLRFDVEFVNWHGNRSNLSIEEAHKRTDATLIGGMNEWGAIAKENIPKMKEEIRQAIHDGGGSLIVGAGCVLPVSVGEKVLQEVVDFLKSLKG